MKQKIKIIVISLMALILFSGCNSSFQDYKLSCMGNSEVQKEVLNKTLGSLGHYDEKYFDKLEKHCIEKYNKNTLN